MIDGRFRLIMLLLIGSLISGCGGSSEATNDDREESAPAEWNASDWDQFNWQ